MKEWKIWQQLYNNLVQDHSDARHKHAFREDPNCVEAALGYVSQCDPVGVYPGKSRAVAIIYATCLAETYGEDFFEVLDDPDLLHGQDEYFVPYSQDKDTYDQILAELAKIPDWIKGGWAPKTVEYFHLECTQAGVDSINGNSMIN